MRATHSLAIDGAGLLLAGPDGTLAQAPACAVYEGDAVGTGRDAVARARLAPLWCTSRYFEELGTDPLPRATPLARSHADLAYAQLAALTREAGLEGVPLLLAAGSAFSIEQLRLLLGVLAAAGVEVTGVVDAAVAATADRPSTPRAFHLDLELHRAVLTELVRADDVRRGRVDLARGTGRRQYDDALAQLLARLFVRATRFDPLHDAAAEQALYDALPGWLAAAAADGESPVAIEHAGLRHETRLSTAQLASAAASLNAELVRLVHSARRAGEAATVFVTERVAALPGIDAALAELRDCEIVRLPADAAARGALAHGAEIEGPELALVSRLAGAPAVLPERAAAREPGGETPTHLVWQGRAWALGAEPLRVGREGDGPRAVVIGGGTALAGVSRAHCTLLAQGGEAVLEDHSSWGTWLNGERVQRRARLRAGDRVRVGSPGVEFELVRLSG